MNFGRPRDALSSRPSLSNLQIFKSSMSLLEQETLVNICRAIKARKVIKILYENLQGGTKDWRMVEPYLVGSFPRKNMQLSAWFLPSPEQVDLGMKGDWRSYTIKNISDLEV